MSARRLGPSAGPRTARTTLSRLFCLTQTAGPDYRSRSVRAPLDFDLVLLTYKLVTDGGPERQRTTTLRKHNKSETRSHGI